MNYEVFSYFFKKMSESEANFVKRVRQEKGFTQQELADICGVSSRTVQNWENGMTIPVSIIKLMKYLIEDSGDVLSASNAKTSVAVKQRDFGNVNLDNGAERLIQIIERTHDELDKFMEITRKKDETIERLVAMIEKQQK